MRSVTISSLAFSLFPGGNGFAFEPLFYARVDYRAGYRPCSVFSADFDNDGDNDLATANDGSNDVSILVNLSDQTENDNDVADWKLPTFFDLSQNYPNPFNSSTVISFSLPEAGRVTVTIYDLLGREIRTLLDEHQQAGIHRITFDASNLPSGIYFCRLQAGESSESRRMVLLK